VWRFPRSPPPPDHIFMNTGTPLAILRTGMGDDVDVRPQGEFCPYLFSPCGFPPDYLFPFFLLSARRVLVVSHKTSAPRRSFSRFRLVLILISFLCRSPRTGRECSAASRVRGSPSKCFLSFCGTVLAPFFGGMGGEPPFRSGYVEFLLETRASPGSLLPTSLAPSLRLVSPISNARFFSPCLDNRLTYRPPTFSRS